MKCENNALCHLCDGIKLYKNTAEENQKKREQRELNKAALKTAPLKTHKKEKKEGMAFEKRVANTWNDRFHKKKSKRPAKPRLDMLLEEEQEVSRDDGGSNSGIPKNLGRPPVSTTTFKKQPEAKRQVNSGAMWHSKGDIVLEHALLECKERGTTNSRGEKTISIPKEWISKQEDEAFQEQRPYWYIPFGYKNDDGIYLVKSFDHEMELVYELRRMREENEQLKKEIQKLKK